MAVHRDVSAHALQFRHVHEAVFKNCFHNAARTVSDRIKRHKLRLHVGGKSRMRHRADIHGLGSLTDPCADPVAAGFYRSARFSQFADHGFKRCRRRVRHENVAARRERRTKKRPRFDAVGHHAVLGAVQFRNPLDLDHGAAGAADFGAHGVKHRRQVHDFGFTRRVFNDGGAFGQNSGHQNIFRTGHGHHVGDDPRTLKPRGLCRHIPVINRDICAKRL